MKHVKHMLVAVLTVFLAAVLAVPAFAEDVTYAITINKNNTDKVAHTYGAYQLFKGDLATVDGKDVLSNIQWGDNVNSASVITELNKLADFDFASTATATEVAKAISDKAYTTDSDGARALAEALNAALSGSPKGNASIAANETSGTISGLAAGYYLVKDTTAISGEGAETKYILEVVKDVTVAEKATVTTVDKEIAETTPTKVSDYNIGDTIPYTITATLPSTFDSYATYTTLTFKDELSAGLTPPAVTDVTVKIGETDISSLFDISVSGQKLTVSLKSGVDLRTATYGTDNTKFANSNQIVVSYSATLNDNAVIGGTGNVNTVTLDFTNNPNSGSDGTPGTTPEDKTVVFTYQINALKVEPTDEKPITEEAYNALTDEQKKEYVKVDNEYQKVKPLKGAGFTLYKSDGTTVVKEIAAGDTTKFEFKGVDAGTYILKETTVPAGYNKVADITITVTPTYDTTTKPPTLTDLTCTPSDFVAIASNGTVEGKILNQSGSVLPSTGGMGTTILYTVGGIMVIAGIVMFLTKRRMASIEK
jgi:fimbrial isopeptide formation D2 family protein/LPXTG-motif cell wall-anchored protein